MSQNEMVFFFSHLNLFLFLPPLSQWLVLPFPSQKLDIILTHPQRQLPFKIINSSQFSQDFLGFSTKVPTSMETGVTCLELSPC